MQLLILIFCLLPIFVESSALPMELNSILLYNNLVKNYQAVLPSCSPGPVQISMDLYLYMLLHFDEKDEVITLNGWYNMNWMDCGLTWNASDYNGMSSIEFPSISKLWTPAISWTEKVPYVKAFEYQDGVFTGSRAFVSSDGSVSLSRQLLIRSSCPLELALFPFDIQNCPLTFLDWLHPLSQLNLKSNLEAGNVTFIVPTGTWDVLAWPLYPQIKTLPSGDNYTALHYVLIVRRESLFYIFYLMLPATVIGLLSCFVFLLPPQTQEKLAFVLSVVVAITVFMLVMVDITPENAQLPIMSAYFFTVFVLASLSATITVLLQIAYENHTIHGVPYCLQRLLLHHLGRFSFFRPTEEQLQIAKRKRKRAIRKDAANASQTVAKALAVSIHLHEWTSPFAPNAPPIDPSESVSSRYSGAVSIFDSDSEFLNLTSLSTSTDYTPKSSECDSTEEKEIKQLELLQFHIWWRVAFAVDRLLFVLYVLSSVVVLLAYSAIVINDRLHYAHFTE